MMVIIPIRSWFLAIACIVLTGSLASSAYADTDFGLEKVIAQSISKVNESWQKNVIEGNHAKASRIYAEDAILMPEYQPTLNGATKIRAYFESLDAKRKIRKLTYETQEMIALGVHVLEIGTFAVDIEWSTAVSMDGSYHGKYWRIWDVGTRSLPVVTGEAFDFFKHIDEPQLWVTDIHARRDPSSSGFKPSDASVELKAYHALGREGVRQKNGDLRAQLYTEDAIFYPFADSPKEGLEVLKPYLIKYSSHGAFIDSVQTHTHDVIYLDEYILKFTKFSVMWTYNENPGEANGKGMKLLKRLPNGELRIHRHIGLHNFDG